MEVESPASSGKNTGFGIRFRPYPKRSALNPSCKHPHAILAQSRGICSDLSNPMMSPSEVSLTVFIFIISTDTRPH